MKRVVTLLLSALFLYGCGGGSGNGPAAATPGGTSTGTPTSSTVGSITIKLVDPASSPTTAKQAAALTADATMAHVVVRQFGTTTETVPTYSYDEDGYATQIGTRLVTTYKETYRKVQNVTITGTTITFQTPLSDPLNVDDKYVFDVLTYLPGTPANTMVKFGTAYDDTLSTNKTFVKVADGMALSLSLADVNDTNVTYVLPTSVKTGSTYHLKATTAKPLRSNYGYEDSLIPSGTGTYLKSCTSGATYTVTPPAATAADKTLYFHFKFYISDDMLDKNDPTDVYTKWIREVPSTNSNSLEISNSNVFYAPLVGVTAS